MTREGIPREGNRGEDTVKTHPHPQRIHSKALSSLDFARFSRIANKNSYPKSRSRGVRVKFFRPCGTADDMVKIRTQKTLTQFEYSQDDGEKRRRKRKKKRNKKKRNEISSEG